jgi:hypothetical protein
MSIIFDFNKITPLQWEILVSLLEDARLNKQTCCKGQSFKSHPAKPSFASDSSYIHKATFKVTVSVNISETHNQFVSNCL